MDLQKLTFPLMIAAAIAGLWVLLRPKTPAQVANQISAAPSGLPNYVPQAQTYQVNTPQLAAPSAPIILSDPYNPNPGQPLAKTPPAYLAINMGPGHDFSKVPLTPEQLAQMSGDRSKCGCGGCGSCGASGYGSTDCSADINHGVFPDGRGGVMAKSGRQLLTRLAGQDPGWLGRAAYNYAGSDVTPDTAPVSTLRVQPITQPTQGAAPAAHTSTLPPATPGAAAVNSKKIPLTEVATPFNSNAITHTVGSVYARQTEVGTNLFTFGHQVPRLSADLIHRLMQIPMNG